MQPWQIALDDESGFTVNCDLSRLLPETDPLNRQITIGFGCFLELVNQAAAEMGYRADISLFPEGEPFPNLDNRTIAKVKLITDESVSTDPLFGGILTRRTNRAAFDLKRPMRIESVENIVAASVKGVHAHSNDLPNYELMELTKKAWEIEWAHAPSRRESIDVSRIGKREVNEKPWGLAMAGPFMEAANKFGFLNRPDMDIAGTASYDQTLAFYNKACETASHYVWTTTTDNTRKDQLRAGRAWVRMQLAANSQGIAFHPLSQALQEFPEMAEPYAKVHEMLAPQGHTVQMLARIGYAKSPPPAPREPLTAKLIDV